jgi:hypothetical protein
MPSIVDTFLFSEPREVELLLLKLTLGDEVVSEWVVAESAYTFRGEHKGLFARRLVETDPRFARFRDRITVISSEAAFPAVRPDDPHGDAITFRSQYAQRDQVLEHLTARWGAVSDAWLFVSDTDECLDGTTPAKRALLQRHLSLSTDFLMFDRVRFWFDIDNVWPAKRYTPLVRIPPLLRFLTTGHSLGEIRGPMTRGWPSAGLEGLVFEYSNCIDRDGVYRKYDTVGHVGMLREDLDRALACNHRPQFRIKGQSVGVSRDDWMHRIVLTERNSPAYVREHYSRLRTGNIADDYEENRRRYYPELFSLRGTLKRTQARLGADLRDTAQSIRHRLQNRRFPSLAD